MKEVTNGDLAAALRAAIEAQEPLVIRGFASDFSLVKAAQSGNNELLKLLQDKASVARVNTLEAPARYQGRVGYREDSFRLNFDRREIAFDKFLSRLAQSQSLESPPLYSIQSAYVSDYLDDLSDEVKLAVWPNVEPRIWIGNRTTVAPHVDDSDNIAVVAAGQRKFTLFPPAQLHNLYVGPVDHTPSGASISLVDINSPDYEAFPRYREAEVTKQVVQLSPGDAIFIPMLWWHQVEALSDINVLLNYWDGGSIGGDDVVNPIQAMLLTRLAMRGRTVKQRKAWQSFFDYYAFAEDQTATQHLPESVHGVLSNHDDSAAAALAANIAKRVVTKNTK
ncbi:cupin-like domain-containing protein [Umboniibacter marinipuniceus]|uniref:Cupin-like protein n=1 Tax=Umboniibacter marinipuniceus TaxID=569599 RepID=A0A3M0AF11_9GAMM|nr:cupin-like domain-containing protein [Umboniibacter marinipuniceus]RMA82279.1 cupin-like protein [Umboniibacter marinipuniceus]